MKKDAGIHLTKLHVDGKMATNNLLMQLQADISGLPICKFLLLIIRLTSILSLFVCLFGFFLVRSQTNDTTSLGCAIAAARAEGIDLMDFSPQNRVYSVKVHHDTYLPTSTDEDRRARNKKWKMAVGRSYGWATTIKSQTMTSKFQLNHHQHVSSSPMLCKL